MNSSFICTDNYSSLTSMCISNDFTIYSFGKCKYGSHGHKEENILSPKQINDFPFIKSISHGLFHTICIDYEGNCYSFGRNDRGQLGIGIDKNKLEFTFKPQKLNLPPIKHISCGNDFTICVSEEGKLYSFGYNDYGQLGLGNVINYNIPQSIPDINDIEILRCNSCSVICKTYNNEFYSWGDNKYGQLGQGTKKSCSKPSLCNNWPENIIDIKSGTWHSLLLTSEGFVYSFGRNNYGQLGLNNKSILSKDTPKLLNSISEIKQIECGDNHNMCIDLNNNLWVFGDNYYGQLGLCDKEIRFNILQHPTLSNIIDISSKGNHTFVKTIDNKIYAFGKNNHSQLGIETSEGNQITPIQVLEGNEDIWCSTIGRSRAKSARK